MGIKRSAKLPARIRCIQDGPDVFKTKTSRQERQQADKEVDLYEQIGRLKMELEWLKKKAAQFN
jgi:hypothetical protein